MTTRRLILALGLALAIAAGTARFSPYAAAVPLRVLLSVPASHGRALAKDRACGRRPHELALLT